MSTGYWKETIYPWEPFTPLERIFLNSLFLGSGCLWSYRYIPRCKWYTLKLWLLSTIDLNIDIWTQRVSMLAMLCHFTYVIFTMSNVGMFFDNHPIAPLLEFARCAFFLAYSQSGFSLLTDSLTWSGLNEMYGPILESTIFMVLRSYFFVSTLVWGIIAFRQSDALRSKMKTN